MASVEIMVGAESATRVVDATPFLAGLVIHKTPDSPAPHELYNVTHRASGLAILTNVPEGSLPAVRRMLGDACWTSSPEEIFADPEYYLLIRSVLSSLRGEDALGDVQDSDRRRSEPDVNWGFFPSVLTPSMKVRSVRGKGSIALTEQELAEWAVQADREGRVPVTLLHLQGKEELAAVPYERFPRGFFLSLKLTRVDATIKGRVLLDEKFADRSVRGHCLLVSFGRLRYVVLGYLAFLSLAKRGLA